jgi:hypothetical protein
VAAVFRQIKDLAVGQPGELGREFVTLARGGADRHGKAVVEQAGNLAFNAADMVEIATTRSPTLPMPGASMASPGGHIDDLARKFAPVRQHVAAEQVNLHALKAALLRRGTDRLLLCQRHHHTG